MTTRTDQRSPVAPCPNLAAGGPMPERRPAMAESTTTPPTATITTRGRFGERLRLTARPATVGQRFLNSAVVWLVLLAFLVLTNLFITVVGAGLERDPRAGLFSWSSLAIFGLAGVVGIWFSHRTGFPAAWDARISNHQRLLYPVLLGLGFGLFQVGLEHLTHGIQFSLDQTGQPAFNVPFPGSLLFYPCCAG